MSYRHDTGWRTLARYRKESQAPRRSRRRRSPSDVVQLLAFLGSPASDVARTIGMHCATLVQVVEQHGPLTPSEHHRLMMWLGAAWWRYMWRTGDDDAADPAAVRAAGEQALHLLWVCPTWQRDHALAAQGWKAQDLGPVKR